MRNHKENRSFKGSMPRIRKTSSDVQITAKALQDKIEQLRMQLNDLVNKRGLDDQSVVKLSQELDTYILQYQQLMAK